MEHTGTIILKKDVASCSKITRKANQAVKIVLLRCSPVRNGPTMHSGMVSYVAVQCSAVTSGVNFEPKIWLLTTRVRSIGPQGAGSEPVGLYGALRCTWSALVIQNILLC